MPKCPPFRHYKQWKDVESFFHENFWAASIQTTACGGDGLFFALHLILGGSLDICGHSNLFLLFT